MLTKLDCSVKNFTYIVHVADIHIRLTQRLEEYAEIFGKFYQEVEKTPDSTAIVIAGDLFHSKSDLSPECIQTAKNFLWSCASLRPTVFIAGNHDATLTNKNRMDSLSPLIYSYTYQEKKSLTSLTNPIFLKQILCDNLYYLKENGLYGLGDILFNNMSIFSDPTEYLSYDKIPKNYKNEYRHHIALYHGVVNGVFTNLNFQLFNKLMPLEKFDGHHIALLGDIHKKQDLQRYDDANNKPAVHYPGSMIQQNHGEDIDDHGFSLWDLNQKTYEHINIPNDYGFFTVEVNKGKLVTDLTKIPKKARVHVKCFESVATEVKAAVATIKSISNVDEVTYTRVDSPDDPSKLKVQTNINLADISDITYQNKLLENFLKEKCKVTDQSMINSVLSINTTLNGKVNKDNFARNLRWKPKKFEFDNMFSYGETNVVDFTKCKGVMGLFGPNACGKSSIFSALSFCLFDKFDRGYKAVDILNVQKTSFQCKFNFEINGVDFFIERKAKMDRKGNVKVDVKFWKEENGIKTELNGEERSDTNRLIREKLGTYEDFILTALSVQSGKNISSFFDMNQSDRKDLISQFIGLVIFDKLLDLASPEIKSLNDALKDYKKSDLELKVQNNNNELSSLTSVYNDENKQIEKLKNEKESLNNEILEETKKLKPVDGRFASMSLKFIEEGISVKESNINTSKKQNVELQTKILEENKILADLDTRIKELEDKNITTSYRSYENAKNILSSLTRKLELKKAEVNNKVSRLNTLKKNREFNPNCEFCLKRNSLEVKELKEITDELEKDKIEVLDLLQNRNKTQLEVDNLSWVIDDQNNYLCLMKARNEKNNEISKMESQFSLNKINIQRKESEIESLKRDLEEYNRQMEAIESNRYIQTSIDQLKTKLKNLDFNIEQKNKSLLTMSRRLGYLQNSIKELTDTIEKIKGLEKQLEAYTLYVKAVNRDGIPYMVISNTVPMVECEVNDILSQMVEFHINIETDGKNVIPYIVYDNRKWPIEMASGFEKFVSSLAIRVALINISNLPRPNFLAIDEGFGVIDAINMPSVQTLLSFLKTNFDFIIVISHLDELRDMVDKYIEVKKDNGFSSVNFV